MSLLSRYKALLQTHPIKSNISSALVISFLGDIAAQYGEHSGLFGVKGGTEERAHLAFSPNLHRTAEMNVWAVFGLTPLNMFQQGYIAQKLWPVWSPASVLKKTLMLVALTAPNNATFFAFRSTYTAWRDHYFFGAAAPTRGGVREDFEKNIRTKLWPTVQTSWSGWTLVNLFNFAVVPPAARHLYTSTFAVIWMSYLSWKANEKGGGEAEEEA